MESDLTNLDPSYDFDRENFKNVKKIMSIKYFNRMKQFMIRLYRNILFVGHNHKNKNSISPSKCYACDNHRESRVELMLNCNTTNELLQLMIRILKKVGCLSNGCKMDMFLFDRYPLTPLRTSLWCSLGSLSIIANLLVAPWVEDHIFLPMRD